MQDESKGVYTGDGSVDINGNRVLRSRTGGWKACPFILGTECCERLAYYGIATNLVTYLTKKLHEGNVTAARNVTTWQGTCYIAPLIGAGMSTLTLSASVPALKPPPCVGDVCPEASVAQYAVFFAGLYFIALGTGGIKPCVSSFGADQFDDTDPKERVRKGSFFNCSLLVWIQDNMGWGLGFGIPTVFMAVAIGASSPGALCTGSRVPGEAPHEVSQVLVASLRKWRISLPSDSSLLFELPDKVSAIRGSRKLEHTQEFRFLDRAAAKVVKVAEEEEERPNPWRLCTVTQVEELKILVRMFPIWATGIVFNAVYAQISTMFVEQGMVMQTKIWGFTIPPASLSVFDVVSVIIWVPFYDRVVRGFSELQRMGVGLFISILAMVAAAVVEIKRLELVKAEGLVETGAPAPLSILWQIPQYFLVGAAEVFTFIGQLESLCSAYSLFATALGNYLSSFILTVVATLSASNGAAGWIPDNLNEGHLDYFFWLLGGLSFLNLLVYLSCAARYQCKKTS
ncbi:unnamed protein product [Spirodela intermedia]|uniref:Uncharacterized protein n=1 Tax=Spirodela intermedia TaxID=51605 RepID=A0A7I8INH0_SPIIN|nr:unnamed protein product [Spirodela intermedia]CAA6659359.1 unnamed protein product [Spirodela intermedia]